MFNTVHRRLLKKSKSYRDWHQNTNSNIVNAFFFLIFSIYLSLVVWSVGMPGLPSEKENLNILGARTGPSNLFDEVNQNKLNIEIIDTEETFTLLITTAKDSKVWIEYDDSANGYYLKTEKTDLSKTHLISLWQFAEEKDYVYRIGATDVDGYTIYSSEYMFIK